MTTPVPFTASRCTRDDLKDIRWVAQDPTGDWYGFRSRPVRSYTYGPQGCWIAPNSSQSRMAVPYHLFLYRDHPYRPKDNTWKQTLTEVRNGFAVRPQTKGA